MSCQRRTSPASATPSWPSRRPSSQRSSRTKTFGYWKVTVERPLRLTVELSQERRDQFRAACQEAREDPLANLVERVAEKIGPGPRRDFNVFMDAIEEDAKGYGVKLTAKRKKLLQGSLAERSEEAEAVIKKIHKAGRVAPNPIRLAWSNPQSKANAAWSSTNRTANCVIPSRCH